jgi:hypothetical protein
LAENIRFDAKPAFILMGKFVEWPTLQEIGFVYQAIGSKSHSPQPSRRRLKEIKEFCLLNRFVHVR